MKKQAKKTPGRGSKRPAKKKRTINPPLLSDISEVDVIMGSQEKLDGLLKGTLSMADETRADMIVLNCMCTPTITGDDIGSLLPGIRKQAQCPVIYVNPRQQGEDADLILEIFKTLPKKKPPRTKRSRGSINLVGMPEPFRSDELEPFLRSIGFKINTRLLPEFDSENIFSYLDATHQLFLENSPEDKKYGEYFDTLPMKTIRLPGPYGMRGSESFFLELGEALGKNRKKAEEAIRALRSDGARWEELAAEARNRRLAFVVDTRSLHASDFLRDMHGKPIMPMLQEMGFEILLLLYRERGHDGESLPPKKQRVRWKETGYPVHIHAFSTEGELNELLSNPEIDAVYTDLFYDWRLTKAGKVQFSSRDFEPGFGGALRTLDALTGICRLDFYQRYAKYLKNVRRS